MTLGGSVSIITLRTADRDRGRWCGCQRSWEVIMWNDLRKWLVVTSSCPLTLQAAERGPWQAVVVTCETCLLQSMIRTIVSGWNMLIIRMYCVSRPDDMFISVVWSSLRQSGKACHVCFMGRLGWGWLGWGWSGWQCVPLVTVRCTPRGMEGGVPTLGAHGCKQHAWQYNPTSKRQYPRLGSQSPWQKLRVGKLKQSRYEDQKSQVMDCRGRDECEYYRLMFMGPRQRFYWNGIKKKEMIKKQ